ncbi:hypothetical protein RND71_009555 [Anisodus tanguticus]|uniref:Uncharacterized protein n=1 Tax=Anisodus tanguticus TaxID=243964 RepID=A0AAE1SHH8_9SOLA|nr:hypothetical protein RND71_009555 [Anisodus tanguticus]
MTFWKAEDYTTKQLYEKEQTRHCPGPTNQSVKRENPLVVAFSLPLMATMQSTGFLLLLFFTERGKRIYCSPPYHATIVPPTPQGVVIITRAVDCSLSYFVWSNDNNAPEEGGGSMPIRSLILIFIPQANTVEVEGLHGTNKLIGADGTGTSSGAALDGADDTGTSSGTASEGADSAGPPSKPVFPTGTTHEMGLTITTIDMLSVSDDKICHKSGREDETIPTSKFFSASIKKEKLKKIGIAILKEAFQMKNEEIAIEMLKAAGRPNFIPQNQVYCSVKVTLFSISSTYMVLLSLYKSDFVMDLSSIMIA